MKFTRKHPLVATLIAAMGTLAVTGANAAGIEAFQDKVNKIAAEHGVKAPDVKKELTAKTNTQSKEEAETEANTKAALSRVAPIERVVTIEANAIRAIKATDGKIMYLVDNGRFAFVGKMFDVWNRQELSTIEEIADAVQKINLDRMGFKLDRVNHISVGQGAKHITIFVDPQCGWCHRLMGEINAKPELMKDYTFDFVVVPVLGDRSTQLAKKLYCANTESDEVKYKALTGGARTIEALEQKADEDCDLEVFNQTRTVAQAVGVQSVPMLIAHDGRWERGKPHDLMAFLEPPKPDANAADTAKAQAAAPQAQKK